MAAKFPERSGLNSTCRGWHYWNNAEPEPELRPKNGWNMFLFQNFGHTTLEDTLWLFNIAMENGPFIDGFSIKNGDFP